MDRIISLLAALVGLIALAAAVLVHVNGDLQRKELAAEIAELRGVASPASASTIAGPASSSEIMLPSAASLEAPSSAPSGALSLVSSADPEAEQIRQLQARIAELEQENRDQASALAVAEARLASAPSSGPQLPMAPPEILSSSVSAAVVSSEAVSAAASSSSEEPSLSPVTASSSVMVSSPADTASADCIPTGTRFVGKPGDRFAICKTPVVVKIVAVSDRIATIDGAGPIAAGSFGDLAGKACSVMVFSADAAGFADLRVTCK